MRNEEKPIVRLAALLFAKTVYTLNTRLKQSSIDHGHQPAVFPRETLMPMIQEEAIQRMQRDHDCMLMLIQRIQASCTQSAYVQSCHQCQTNNRELCHANIEQLVKAFVEATLKHNVIESLYMQDGVPAEHRIAHNKAHRMIAEKLQAIRIVFSEDGNCVLAIHGIDDALSTLQAHFIEYDQQLESYLLQPH
jgi:hemerythrin